MKMVDQWVNALVSHESLHGKLHIARHNLLYKLDIHCTGNAL